MPQPQDATSIRIHECHTATTFYHTAQVLPAHVKATRPQPLAHGTGDPVHDADQIPLFQSHHLNTANAAFLNELRTARQPDVSCWLHGNHDISQTVASGVQSTLDRSDRAVEGSAHFLQ
jgi:hypothetical protein